MYKLHANAVLLGAVWPFQSFFAQKKQDFLSMLSTKELFIACYVHRNSIYKCLHFLFNGKKKIPVPKAKRLLLI